MNTTINSMLQEGFEEGEPECGSIVTMVQPSKSLL